MDKYVLTWKMVKNDERPLRWMRLMKIKNNYENYQTDEQVTKAGK